MEQLEEKVIEDFAEIILKNLGEKPKEARFGITHFIQFVRDRYQSEEETRYYKTIVGSVPKYIQAAVNSLLSQKKIEEHAGAGDWDKRYSLK